jgi:hypothetical protein
MRTHELLRSPSFEHALREAAALVEADDEGLLTAHLAARDGVLTVTVPFIYGVSLRVGGHYVGSTAGWSTASVAEVLDALERNGEFPHIGSRPLNARTSGDDARSAPLAGWNEVTRIDRDRFETLVCRADRRLMAALDRRSGTDTGDSEASCDEREEIAAAALSLPVDAWDMGDGALIQLPGSLVFAAAMIGGLGEILVLLEQGPWLCLSAGSVEFLARADADSWRVAIT